MQAAEESLICYMFVLVDDFNVTSKQKQEQELNDVTSDNVGGLSYLPLVSSLPPLDRGP